MRAGTAWRALTLLGLLLAAASLVVGVLLFAKTTDTAEENRDTLCSVGGFLTGAPVLRIPGTGREDFIGQLIATRAFLSDLRELDCPRDPGFGAGVTAEAIERQLERIRAALEHQQRRLETAGGQAGATGSPAGPGSDPSGTSGTSSTSPNTPLGGVDEVITSPTVDGGDQGGDGGGGTTIPPPPVSPDEPAPSVFDDAEDTVHEIGDGVGHTIDQVGDTVGHACERLGVTVPGAC